jgi:hypothetical protein
MSESWRGEKILIKDGVLYAILFRGMFSHVSFSSAVDALEAHCGEYVNVYYGKKTVAPRKSFVVAQPYYGDLQPYYGDLNCLPWEACPLVSSIKTEIEEKILNPLVTSRSNQSGPSTGGNGHFHYALVHKYDTGRQHIGWHNDKEALDTAVVSVTFLPPGAPARPFLFREIGVKYKGRDCHTDVRLAHGDVLLMMPGCQRKWKHAVLRHDPKKDKRGNSTGYRWKRFNITFRQMDPRGRRNPTNTRVITNNRGTPRQTVAEPQEPEILPLSSYVPRAPVEKTPRREPPANKTPKRGAPAENQAHLYKSDVQLSKRQRLIY